MIIPKYTSLFLFGTLIPSFSLPRHVFILSSMISNPLSSLFPSFIGFHTLTLSSLPPNPSLFSSTHSQCIIQAEIPARRAWPLKIHGDAMLRLFSGASPRWRSATGQGSEGREREDREEGGSVREGGNTRRRVGDEMKQNNKAGKA